MSILKTLTEGIEPRDLHKESNALLSKWERTGLLEGLNSDDHRHQMARLLENQAKELLRESSAMAGGDVEGFAAVAFPLVRRVFGSLVAQDIVSVQPMSLPSGLIFFMDFTFSADGGGLTSGTNHRLGNIGGDSIYGGGRVASQITGGMILTGVDAERGPYALNNGYSSPTGTLALGAQLTVTSGTIDANGSFEVNVNGTYASGMTLAIANSILRYDPDLVSGSVVAIGTTPVATLLATDWNQDDLVGLTSTGSLSITNTTQARRLTSIKDIGGTDHLGVIFVSTTGSSTALTAAQTIEIGASLALVADLDAPLADDFAKGDAIGSVVGQDLWGLENNADIPEIDIKVDSVSVTAVTKKLKAKWTPELGQDLNAYHNMDAEVELTSILSEQVALEIDREILEDLVKGATASTYYWSRRPGRFVDRSTGADIGGGSENEALLGADFTGNVSEWYETLIETINDVSAQIHRKTLRGGANFVVVSPEMANLLEFTSGFRGAVTHDDDRGTIGAVRVGSLSKKFDVYVDPYFLRNVVLVGRKGASFLESGYVYAPYVPLQVTPTIFGVEDFVPRKGVMTRYAKKMVRPDMYGLVIVKDLLG
jgi:hypothetical protein